MFKFRNTLDYKELPIYGKALCWAICPFVHAYTEIRRTIDKFSGELRYISTEGH